MAKQENHSEFSKHFKFVLFCIEGYTHIHVIDPNTATKSQHQHIGKGKPETLYTTGNFLDMKNKIRAGKFTIAQMEELGNLGLGSAGRGSEERGDFCGGGEVTFFPEYGAHRTIRGNENYHMSPEDTCWNFDVVNFNGSEKKTDLPDIYNSKAELSNAIRTALALKNDNSPFVATGLISFANSHDPIARSNGVYPDDKVADRTQDVFPISEAKGGHIASGNETGNEVNFTRNESGDYKTISGAKIDKAPGFICRIKDAKAMEIKETVIVPQIC